MTNVWHHQNLRGAMKKHAKHLYKNGFSIFSFHLVVIVDNTTQDTGQRMDD